MNALVHKQTQSPADNLCFYPDSETLNKMVGQIDPLLNIEGYYDEQGFETSPGLHKKKLEQAQSLAMTLFKLAVSGVQKSQPEGRL